MLAEGDVFRALADPTRRAIFQALVRGESAVKDLTGFAVSQPAVSQHLAVLRQAGLVAERRAGRNSFYRAKPEGLQPLIDWLSDYQGFWRDHLNRLELLLEAMDK